MTAEPSQTAADWFKEYLAESTRDLPSRPWTPPTPLDLDYELDPNPPWTIGPCLKPGDCAYFVGQDGHGKTSLIADIMVGILLPDQPRQTSLCGAWDINDFYLPPFSDLLVINAETSSRDDWHRMIKHTLVARGIPLDSPAVRHVLKRIWYVHADELSLAGPTREANTIALGNWIVSQGFRLVVLDPVFNCFAPEDNADSGWVHHGLTPLINILKPAGINTFCIAHPAADSQQFGKRGGPSLDRYFTPFGSSQQRNVIDARFGVRGDTKDSRKILLHKLKDRRAGWIPKKSYLTLTFGPNGGYTSVSGTQYWPYKNPDPFVLSESAKEILRTLPYPGPFRMADITAAKIKKRDFETARDAYFLPQQLLTATELTNERGKPIEYDWDENGELQRDAWREAESAKKRSSAK